jgi:tetratricopeptide (TPR) repeat protein
MATSKAGNTIFLTEQEAERIRNTVKDRLRKCSEIKGNAREPREPQDAIKQATGASLMADIGGASDPDTTQTNGRGGTLPVIPVGQPYLPCVVPLRRLQPMKIAELMMETHHRGRKLAIKRASPVVTLASRSWTMVRDEEGEETERLEVLLHKSRHGEDVLESASRFVIKEPYFTITEQGEPTLRIDHPSDLVVCTDEAENAANGDSEDAAVVEKIARKFKDEGNAALKKQDLPLAYQKYSQGLKVARQGSAPDTIRELVRDISRNRAYVNLLLNQLDEAITDAKASLIGNEDQRSKELDAKAYYRAGCAAYNLGHFEEAKSYFEEQQKLVPTDKDASINLRRIEIRLREQNTGKYDFKKIRASATSARPRVDAASFVSNIEVKNSPGRGRGAFATRNIPAGEIVICEKTFCIVWGHEEEALTAITYDVRDDRIRVSPVGLGKATMQRLLNNPSQSRRVMDLYGDWKGFGKALSSEEGPVIDAFRVHDIVSRNGFGLGSLYGEEDASNASTGLWIWSAYFNHSCIPNATKECIGDLMVYRAIRPIAAGEEIFQAYDQSADYDARQAALMTTWGFECNCALCVAEKADDPAVRKKRRELAAETDAFVEREHWANAKRLVIAKAQRLARAIDETYDSERYKGLPRVATERIQTWLTTAKPRR